MDKDKDLEVVEVELDKAKEEDSQSTPELSEDEKAAESKGWQTKEAWIESGKPEDEWKPAKVFNEIGDLKDKLSEKEREAKKLNKVVDLMKKHHLNVREAAVKQALDQLRKERRDALDSQDFAKAEKLRDDMDELKVKAERGTALPVEIETQIREVETTPDPAFVQFRERNPWYKPGSGDEDEMSRKADALGYAYSAQSPKTPFDTVLKKVEADIKRLFPDKFSTPRTPVNESGTRTGHESDSKEKVSLSDAEKAVAKSFGMTNEEYAKELKSYRGR
jgi:hypothetical protein